jgi:hypothetical protein
VTKAGCDRHTLWDQDQLCSALDCSQAMTVPISGLTMKDMCQTSRAHVSYLRVHDPIDMRAGCCPYYSLFDRKEPLLGVLIVLLEANSQSNRTSAKVKRTCHGWICLHSRTELIHLRHRTDREQIATRTDPQLKHRHLVLGEASPTNPDDILTIACFTLWNHQGTEILSYPSGPLETVQNRCKG